MTDRPLLITLTACGVLSWVAVFAFGGVTIAVALFLTGAWLLLVAAGWMTGGEE